MSLNGVLMNTVVIRPTFLWIPDFWKATDRRYLKYSLARLIISGALKSALEITLDLIPIDLVRRSLAAKSASTVTDQSCKRYE